VHHSRRIRLSATRFRENEGEQPVTKRALQEGLARQRHAMPRQDLVEPRYASSPFARGVSPLGLCGCILEDSRAHAVAVRGDATKKPEQDELTYYVSFFSRTQPAVRSLAATPAKPRRRRSSRARWLARSARSFTRRRSATTSRPASAVVSPSRN